MVIRMITCISMHARVRYIHYNTCIHYNTSQLCAGIARASIHIAEIWNLMACPRATLPVVRIKASFQQTPTSCR